MSDAFKKFDLTGKTALVTGGATGLGYNMTRALLRSGAKVMIAARREELLKEAAQKLMSESPRGTVIYHRTNLNQRDSVNELAEHALYTLGSVDIFIGNAGLLLYEPVEKTTAANIDQMIQVNLTANIELSRALIPAMRRKRWGRIIFSSSVASLNAEAQGGNALYSATKAALNAFVRTAAAEHGHAGITVNSLIFGMFLTDMTVDAFAEIEKKQGKGAAKALIESYASMTALGRPARCDELEGLIQFVASDAASYLTATNLVFDGGMTIMLRPNPSPADPVYPAI